jgi:hypothetical protein
MYLIFFFISVLLRFQEKHRRNPEGSTSEQDIDDLLKMKNEVFESLDISQDLVLEDFARSVCGINTSGHFNSFLYHRFSTTN